jgi:hypothetical protein
LKPRCDIQAVAEDVFALRNDITEVNYDPELDPFGGGIAALRSLPRR